MKKVLKRLRAATAVGACRTVREALRLVGKGGTALPGRAAMLVDPHVLREASRGVNTIVVTGSNGKTTTANLIASAISRAGFRVIANRSGSNMLPGVTAEFCADAPVLGGKRRPFAVIECDEGSMPSVTPQLRPRVIVVTNLFRDQTDRYGSVENVRRAIRAAAERSPETVLCLNADDPATAELAEGLPNPVLRYGLDAPQTPGEDAPDGLGVCPRCGGALAYEYRTVAHLGGFRCPECGCARRTPQISAGDIDTKDPDRSVFTLSVARGRALRKSTVRLPLPALYNVYNAAAAAAGLTAAGFGTDTVADALENAECSFGRMEDFTLGGVKARMILVKNAVSMNQALAYLRAAREPFNAVFCLNDRPADGRDVSWLEDADFERFCAESKARTIRIFGMRADALRERLVRAGFPPERVIPAKTEKELLAAVKSSDLPVYILPNYTAMLSFREKLCAESGNREFWKG